MERNLCAGTDYQTIVFIQPADDDMRFQRSLLNLLCMEYSFDDQIGFGKILL